VAVRGELQSDGLSGGAGNNLTSHVGVECIVSRARTDEPVAETHAVRTLDVSIHREHEHIFGENTLNFAAVTFPFGQAREAMLTPSCFL